LVLINFLFVSQQTSIFDQMVKSSTLAMVQVFLLWNASISGSVRAAVNQVEIEAFEVGSQAHFTAYKDEEFEVGAQAGGSKSIAPENCHKCCEQPGVVAQAQWLKSEKAKKQPPDLNCNNQAKADKKICGSAGKKLCKKDCQKTVAPKTKKGCNFEKYIEDQCKATCDDQDRPSIEEVQLSADMYAAMSRGDTEKIQELHTKFIAAADKHSAAIDKFNTASAKKTQAKKKNLADVAEKKKAADETFAQAAAAQKKKQADENNWFTRTIDFFVGEVASKDRDFVSSGLADAYTAAAALETARADEQAEGERLEAAVNEALAGEQDAGAALEAALQELKNHQAQAAKNAKNAKLQELIKKQQDLCNRACKERFNQIPFFSPTKEIASFSEFLKEMQEIPPPPPAPVLKRA